MTIAPHHSEVHHMVDQLSPGQIEALYVILQGMVHRMDKGERDTAEEMDTPSSPTNHRFSFIGIMDGEPDLAERSAQILRDELGNPAT